MHRILFLSSSIIAALLLLISILSINGNIQFGGGLGDIAFIALAGGSAISLVIFLIILRKPINSNKLTLLIVFLLSLSVLCYFVYSFTIGRGPENSWNGSFFS